MESEWYFMTYEDIMELNENEKEMAFLLDRKRQGISSLFKDKRLCDTIVKKGNTLILKNSKKVLNSINDIFEFYYADGKSKYITNISMLRNETKILNKYYASKIVFDFIKSEIYKKKVVSVKFLYVPRHLMDNYVAKIVLLGFSEIFKEYPYLILCSNKELLVLTDVYWTVRNVCLNVFVNQPFLKKIYIDCFDLSETTSLYGMFRNSSSLEEIVLKNFDTKSVKDMSQIFWLCNNLKKVNYRDFDYSNVTTVFGMFQSCGLQHINLSNLDFSNISCLADLFCDCFNLESVSLDNLKLHSRPNVKDLFFNCNSLKEIKGKMSGPGHNSVVKLGENDYLCVYHVLTDSAHPSEDRQVFMSRMKIVNDRVVIEEPEF